MLPIAVLLVLAQPRAESSTEATIERGHRECADIVVTSPQQTKRRVGMPFSATRILDLQFSSRMRRRLAGEHVLQFKVYTPRGHLYQPLTVPFTSLGRRKGDRWVDGFPRPLPEQAQRPVDDGGVRRYEVSATLPVGGTAIMSNSLYGRWRVEAFLDSDLHPCGTAARFDIQP